MKSNRLRSCFLVAALTPLWGCSSGQAPVGGPAAPGGANTAGGTTVTGGGRAGGVAQGGAPTTGGATAPATGGLVSVGGSTSGGAGGQSRSGGDPGSGGVLAGGASASGGSLPSTGGAPTGGAAGGGLPSGGTASGGAAGAAGRGGTVSGDAGQGGLAATGGAVLAVDAGQGGAAAPDAGKDAPAAGGGAPKVEGTTYHFAVGEIDLVVDGAVGARVSRLTFGGSTMVMPTAADLTTWGSTFWTSPRSAWTPQTWPPSVAIDNGPYTGQVSGTHAVFVGAADASMGIRIEKDYAVDAATGWISIAYTIRATKAIKAAPWEVTRVPRGGIVLFPSGGAALTKGPWTSITQSGGTTWIDDTAKTTTSSDGSKAYGDGGGGWLAYAVGGALFLKKFADTPAGSQAPGDGEIGIYSGSGFLEFEVQGPYAQIAAGSATTWPIQWRLAKIPSTVAVSVGSASLAAFAAQQAAL